MRALATVLLLAFAVSPATASVVSQWTELGAGGTAEVRAVVKGDTACPSVTIDGASHAMASRAAADDKFALVCSVVLPGNAKNVTLEGRPVRLPVAAPKRIVVLGDTGCRIKPPALQDCNDPKSWPFPLIAKAAADLHPDLVIHVGDYLYRESACPPGDAGCAGSPSGDAWDTWAADFFSPAAPLLAAAPIVIVRGNHESCARAGGGFLRLLGPGAFDPKVACSDHLAPFAVPAGPMNLVVFDDAAAPDTSVADALLPAFQSDFAGLAAIAPKPLWLLMHRPIWGLVKGPLGLPIGGNLTMITAAGDLSEFATVELMLAGHIHTFEAINYAAKLPPQILAGHGGDNLDPTPADLRGATFQGHSGVAVKDGLSVGGFGFLLMTDTAKGWTIDLYKVDGSTEGQCLFAAGRLDCSGIAAKH